MSSPYSRWQDSMFAQMRLIEWYQTPEGLKYLWSFYESMNDKTEQPHRRDIRVIAGIHLRTLLEAEPVWVSAEAVELINHARKTFEPEPVLPNDPFVPFGFALFAEPMMMRDAPWMDEEPGRSPSGFLPVRAIAWMPVHDEEVEHGCFWIQMFVHVDDELEHNVGGVHRWQDPDHGPEHIDHLRRIGLMVGHSFQWTWGDAPWTKPELLESVLGENLEQSAQRAKEQSQMVQTLWRIGSQFVPAKVRADRHMRRQAKRRKLAKADEVTVIRLRRAREYGEHESSGRQLTVQHLVRGYWGLRYTREGPRQVWVRPHLKGPPDAPFKQTTRAWEFTR